MRLTKKVLVLTALSLFFSWMGAHGQKGGPRSRSVAVVMTDTEAFILGPAQMIAGPEVNIAGLSSDGRYVLATRTAFDMPPNALPPPGPPSGEISLLLWDSRTRRSSIVWKSAISENKGRFATIDKVEWLPGTDTALARIGVAQVSANQAPRIRRSLLFINAASGLVRTVATLGEYDSVHVSPTQPAAALIEIEASASEAHYTAAASTLRIVGASGNMGPVVRLPQGAFAAGFAPDGASLYLCAYVEPVRKGERATQNWYALAIGTGALTPLEKRPQIAGTVTKPLAAMADALPIRIKPGTATVKEQNTTLPVRPLWLESITKSETPRALLAADADGGFVLPGGNAALYQSQGALYAVPLLRMDKAAFLEARQKAQQAATLSNAKQIGTALMMYVQDYDEVYPAANDGINDQIMPYIKNDAVFTNPATNGPGFVYTYAGGPLSGITAPAETIIGYVNGPGGRAVIYADGHVVWKPS